MSADIPGNRREIVQAGNFRRDGTTVNRRRDVCYRNLARGDCRYSATTGREFAALSVFLVGSYFYATPDAFRRALPLCLFSAQSPIIVGHDGGSELANGRYYEPTIRFLKPHLTASLFRKIDDQLWVRAEPEAAAPSGKYFLGFNAEWHNYAHLLTDTLPLLYFYKQNLHDECELIVPSLSTDSVYGRFIALLGIDARRLYVVPHKRVQFEQILFTTPISLWSQTGLLNSATDALIEGVLARLDDAKRPATKRLYLSRADATTRQLLNEPTLIKKLQRLGFEEVKCSALSFEEQVLLFNQAEFVVAPHGAALGNLLFCPHGTSVLELFPEYCVQPHFQGLAVRRKLKYGYLVGTSLEHENSRALQSGWDEDFVIDEDMVIQAIHTMIAKHGRRRT